MRDTSESGLFSCDEVMVPYYGRHSTKQYIHGKPVRYGYKVWALCTSGGSYVEDVEVEDFKNIGRTGA